MPEALDNTMPSECTDLSIVRVRGFKPEDTVSSRGNIIGGHVDSGRDFRRIVVLGGKGCMQYGEGLVNIPLAEGDVIGLDNRKNRKDRTFHQTKAHSKLLLLVYGKSER